MWCARFALSRTGIVVGPNGGFLQRMILAIKTGVVASLARGRAVTCLGARQDVVRGFAWMFDYRDRSGAYNVVFSPRLGEQCNILQNLGSVLPSPYDFAGTSAVGLKSWRWAKCPDCC